MLRYIGSGQQQAEVAAGRDVTTENQTLSFTSEQSNLHYALYVLNTESLQQAFKCTFVSCGNVHLSHACLQSLQDDLSLPNLLDDQSCMKKIIKPGCYIFIFGKIS